MRVYHVNEEPFSKYGQVLQGYDFTGLLDALSALSVPEEGIVYEPSIPSLEKSSAKETCFLNGFGGMPIQIGYVGGNNRVLNCLEYHKSSEFNIALDDVILVLGQQTDIQNGVFDTANCEAFLLPAGMGVELYATTLHYAPMNVAEESYRVACVLPLGTNGPKPDIKVLSQEDRFCAGANKWLLAHVASEDAQKGATVGLKGENITFETLKL